jgi:hypothetical protein
MHCAIEMTELRLTHFHPIADVVGGLVYLESAKLKHVRFDDTFSPNFLDSLTTLELDKLCLNTTGLPFPPSLDDLARRDALATLIEGLTPQVVDRDELAAQIDAVSDQLEAPVSTATQFKYVLGARVPRELDGGLFPIAAPPRNAEQLAESAQLAPQRRSARSASTVPAAQAKRTARPPSERSTVPSGGSRPAIWAHADKVWEAAGKPMNPAEVLVLRKRMMIELEEQGIKKTTSSTALGDWMKQRLKV